MTAAVAAPHSAGKERDRRLDPASWRPWTVPGVPSPAPDTAAPPAAPPAAPSRHEPARLHVRARHVAAMPSYAPFLVSTARALLDADGAGRSGPRELVVDLSEVPPGPYCAELVFLVGLLRRALRPGRLRLVGVDPVVAAPLVGGGLGEDVVVVDTRGRTWPGEPDRVRPTGTWP